MPRVDHHQHVLGPVALPRTDPPLPAVELPPELDRLLDERSRLYAHAKSAADLARAFTEEAQVISWQRPSRWVRGEQELLDVLNQVISQRYRFVANAYGIEGTLGYVAGTVAVGEGESTRHALDFLLAVQKTADGSWRIVAENTTIKSAPLYAAPITADEVVGELDEAGIERAIVLSVAFWLGSRFDDPADEMTRERDAVRAENDWTAEQAGRHPERLVMACSANPLRAYAIQELERCRRMPQVQAFKLHFADSSIDFDDPGHLDALGRFFEAANRLRLPLIVHLKPRTDYGRREIGIFLDRILVHAPDIPVQIAHMAGDGPSLDAPEALAALAEARAAKDPRTRNLYFDFAGLATKNTTPEEAELMVRRMRQIGLEHVLYGSDGQPPNATTAEHWMHTRRALPLTNAELSLLADNVAPYMRR